ncbi:MAG: phosphatase PAP2 family protein [Burkholderiaceae bacterium]
MTPRYPVFATRRWAMLAVMLMAMITVLFFFVDMPLARTLHVSSTPWVFAVFNVIDELGSSELYLAPALVLYVWALLAARRGWTLPLGRDADRVARGSLFVILTMALGGIVTVLLKNLVARARPELLIEQGLYGFGTAFARAHEFDSFPSSHTQAAFAAAAALAILAPRLRVPLMLLACSVATARVVNLDHYLSDVLGAAFIALSSAAFLAPRILNADSGWPLRTPWRWFGSRTATRA